jgi:hypothetical protein
MSLGPVVVILSVSVYLSFPFLHGFMPRGCFPWKPPFSFDLIRTFTLEI